MVNFKSFSRDGRAQGKPRVYFSCHPSDVEFFDEVRRDVLALCDCAVYFCDDFSQNLDCDDYALSLSQMQLFVFPITYRFLTEDTRAFRDFTWAKSHSIPVLPLMYGDGLEKLFNAKCGDIQFLDKRAVDDTAISFKTKLSDFLTSSLISDEVRDKIRQAFDAYVFLSYRKKDRMHANEVMRKLHSHDFARDIAIWFDEYLVPGENFNDAIMDALLKSDLFALLVTPNIVNEANYVRDVEYPEALKAGKKVFAIEAVATDGELLKSGFSGIPKPLSPDELDFEKEFINSLKNLSIRENDSPEHDFYIALAYMHGVDVEVDKSRAVKILSSCAEKGVREACSILSHSYNVGDGVKCDYIKSYEYARRALDLSTTDDERIDSLSAISRALLLRLDLSKEEKSKSLKSIYSDLLELLAKDEEKNALKLMQTYCTVVGLSAPFEIADLLQKADTLAQKTKNKNADFDLAYACLLKSVGLRLIYDEPDTAERLIKDARDEFSKLLDFVVPDAKAHLVDLYVKTGNAYENSAQFDEAKFLYEKALVLAVELTSNDLLFTALVGRIKFLIADLTLTQEEDGEGAKKLLLSAISDFERLSKEKGEQFLLGSALSLDKLSYVYETAFGDIEKAIETKSKAIDILNSMSRYDSLVPLSWLAEKRYELGNVYATNGMLDLAVEILDKAYSELKISGARQSLQAECSFYLAVTYADLGDLNKAVEVLEEGLGVATSSLNTDEGSYIWQENILSILNKMRACL